MQPVVLKKLITVFFLVLTGFVFFNLASCKSRPVLSKQQLIQQAEIDLKNGEFHKALTELNEVVSQDPNNLQVHVDLGWIYFYLDDMDNAMEELKIINDINLHYEKAYYLKGAIYHRLEQWEDALENYNAALKTEIANPRLHGDIAEVFMELNFFNEALKEFDIALKLHPQNSEFEFGRCMAYRHMKKYYYAINACKNAIEYSKDPTQSEQEKINEVIEEIKLLQLIEPSNVNEKIR